MNNFFEVAKQFATFTTCINFVVISVLSRTTVHIESRIFSKSMKDISCPERYPYIENNENLIFNTTTRYSHFPE